MGSCKFVKDPNAPGYKESSKQLTSIIHKGITNALKMSNRGENIPLLGKGIEDMLIEIGETFNNRYLDSIAPVVEKILKMKNLHGLIPASGLINTMNPRKRVQT